MNIIEKNIPELKEYENNPRHNDGAVDAVAESIKQFGFKVPIIIDSDGIIIAGHTRLKAAKSLGLKTVPCIIADDLTPEQVKAFRLADNKVGELAEWDFDLLEQELAELGDFDMTDFGFDLLEFEEEQQEEPKNKLTDIFGIPPFSVIDGRSGVFINNNKAWKQLGIKSELGRDDNLMNAGAMIEGIKSSFKTMAPDTSVFAPFLCELMYKWFCVQDGNIFDCFAGGSVRGIVAEKLGYKYTGIELRQEQVDANYKNADELECTPNWICDDSLNMDNHIENGTQDMLFTCPPYADLEVYSDDPRDISNMEYAKFVEVYSEIIKKTYNKLKDNSFAVCVVGEVRSKDGNYYNFVGDTIKAFLDAGYKYYNEIIYITPAGTNALRARQFNISRKVVKGHQNVLVFYKGDSKDTKAIKSKFGEINFDESSFSWSEEE